MAGHRRERPDGVVSEAVTDLKRFHERWMGLVYPRQVGTADTVLGKWKPRSQGGLSKYRLWAALGVVVVAVLYPVALFGAILRFQTRRVDRTAAHLGVLGVLVVAGAAWGLLALLARARFTYDGFLAVAAAGVVATVSAVLALVFARVDGRATTVILAYPLGVTAFFLPPVVAALYSPALAAVVFPGSESLAIWILANVFEPVGLRSVLHAYFDLAGVGYVLMWFAIAVPVGWLLGSLVTLANVARPRREDD